MHDLIKDFINRFGGRLAGSQAERDAQDYLFEKLKGFCTYADRHNFEAPLGAKPGSARLFAIVYFAALLLFWVSPLAAFFLSLLNAVCFYGHFVSYRGWLDFLYPKKRSLNIMGVLEPKEAVKSTILISAHMDSTKEFVWWYWLKDNGARLMVVGGLLFLFQPVFYLVVLLFSSGPDWSVIAWWFLTAISPAIFTYLYMRGSIVVDGAQDNLSGIVVAYETVRSFISEGQKGNSSLKHTRLKMVSFGSEEAGLVGSMKFAETFGESLKDENAILVNLDGIMNMDEFHIVRKERMTGALYSEDLIGKLSAAFDQEEVKHRISDLLIGATDAASLLRKGIPSVTLLGLPIDRLDPTYHTRLDTPEHVDPNALEACRKVLCAFISAWDDEV
ncbi:MAG: M20/M25/M40 family metallo-hydrolase [Bacteroidota bacterium]